MKLYKLLLIGCLLTTGAPLLAQTPSIVSQAQSFAISTDKAAYNPGDVVQFTLQQPAPLGSYVKYLHLDKIISTQKITGNTWKWKAPATDYTGYLAVVYHKLKDKEKVWSSIGIDVSSNWGKYPRYGFLSHYNKMDTAQTNDVVKNLNRYHINGIQFYDWHYEHHQPLAGTVAKPDTMWKDIANRPIYFNTVQNYIAAAHKHGMKAMFYNLVYGALKDAGSAVDDKWYMYIDKNHGTKEKFALPSNFVSDIFFTDPANADWQKFITKENAKVYEVFPFDGYHMDQVGNRDKKLYDYNGREIALDETFGQFVSGIKTLEPKRPVVMNAVNQYGGQGIGKSPVEFMYTEVWPPNDDFTALARNITDNDEWSDYKKATILAAYMNYDNAENKGWVNTPSILLADAVIFAFGGAHLELGEHMLCKEYFPNNNLQMKDDLKASLVTYYDFLVGYENLLRGGKLYTPDVASLNSNVKVNAWPAQKGSISVTGRKVGNKDVLHFINFSNAAHMNWRDNKGTQTEPEAIQNISLHINASGKAKKVWVASPDNDGAAPQELKFRQDNNHVIVTLPGIKYWDMLVIEY